jgi:hypothetical protein
MNSEVKQMNPDVSMEQVQTIVKTAERALANSEASLARLARETGAELIRIRIIPESSSSSATDSDSKP